MTLYPYLPIKADETVMSYANRLAAFHVNQPVKGFLSDCSISMPRLSVGMPESLAALAKLSGASSEDLARSSFSPVDAHYYSFRGQRFLVGFVESVSFRFCPRCFLQDAASPLPHNAHRYARAVWAFKSVRTCSEHECFLVERPVKDRRGLVFDINELVPETDHELKEISRDLVRAPCSDLQTYIERRLDGSVGPEWLDSLDIDLAAGFVEALGLLLTKGPKATVGREKTEVLHEAGQAAFPFVAVGPDGVHALLREVVRRNGELSDYASPPAVFGNFYRWLTTPRKNWDMNPVWEVVRNFIVENLPLPSNGIVLGQMAQRKWHSARTLSAATKLPDEVARRVFASAPSEVKNEFGFLDALVAKELVAITDRPLGKGRGAEMLGVSLAAFDRLVAAGIIADAPQTYGVEPNVISQFKSIETLLTRLRDRLVCVDAPKSGHRRLLDATRLMGAELARVIKALLDGELANAQILNHAPNLSGVYVDPVELSALLPKGRIVPLLEAADMLDLTDRQLKAITIVRPPNDQPFVQTAFDRSGNPIMTSFHEADLKAFAANFVSRRRLAREQAIQVYELDRRLKKIGIEPVVRTRSRGSPILYRRSDIPAQI